MDMLRSIIEHFNIKFLKEDFRKIGIALVSGGLASIFCSIW